MKIFKLNRSDPIEIGSIVKAKQTIPNKKIIGEVVNILTDSRKQVELIQYDNRLRPMYNYDGSTYRRVRVDMSTCKLIDENFVFDSNGNFELGDVVCYKTNLKSKFGIVVGFTNPDGLISTSYEHGYNGTDLIDCVEINKRGLTRKRNLTGQLKRFSVFGNKIKKCTIDLWNKTGPKILV